MEHSARMKQNKSWIRQSSITHRSMRAGSMLLK